MPSAFCGPCSVQSYFNNLCEVLFNERVYKIMKKKYWGKCIQNQWRYISNRKKCVYLEHERKNQWMIYFNRDRVSKKLGHRFLNKCSGVTNVNLIPQFPMAPGLQRRGSGLISGRRMDGVREEPCLLLKIFVQLDLVPGV